jgi:hypothetical protein
MQPLLFGGRVYTSPSNNARLEAKLRFNSLTILGGQLLPRIFRILRDLFADGYSVVGAIAPILSIAFTFAKALDLTIHLRDVSYAWGLIPILLWVVVAYVRRHSRVVALEQEQDNKQARADGLARLGQLREQGVALRNKSVSSQQEMDQWNSDQQKWINDIQDAAGAISPPLRDRLQTLDTVGPGPKLSLGFSPEHTHFRNIMSEMIKRVGDYLEKNQ